MPNNLSQRSAEAESVTRDGAKLTDRPKPVRNNQSRDEDEKSQGRLHIRTTGGKDTCICADL